MQLMVVEPGEIEQQLHLVEYFRGVIHCPYFLVLTCSLRKRQKTLSYLTGGRISLTHVKTVLFHAVFCEYGSGPRA